MQQPWCLWERIQVLQSDSIAYGPGCLIDTEGRRSRTHMRCLMACAPECQRYRHWFAVRDPNPAPFADRPAEGMKESRRQASTLPSLEPLCSCAKCMPHAQRQGRAGQHGQLPVLSCHGGHCRTDPTPSVSGSSQIADATGDGYCAGLLLICPWYAAKAILCTLVSAKLELGSHCLQLESEESFKTAISSSSGMQCSNSALHCQLLSDTLM